MRRIILIAVVALAVAGCSGGGGEDRGQRPWSEAPTETERPPYIVELAPDAVPYELDYGEILWMDGSVGRLIGATGRCEDLMAPYDIDEWHDRYADIPGFEGVVCNGSD